MPVVRHAHLLLPSALGLLEYDVVEDAVFLGPGKRGLLAKAAPFKDARVALTRSPNGFVVRPLPGEAAPEVNGEATAEATLSDGDRIKIGEHVALFRTDRGPVRASAPAAATSTARAGAARSGEGRRASGARSRKSPANTIIGLIGAVIILIASVRAVSHLTAIQSEKQSKAEIPDTPKVMVAQPSRAATHLAAARAYEENHPTRYGEIVKRYRAFVDHHAGTPEVDIAQGRLREMMEAWATRERATLDQTVDKLIGARQFDRAGILVREFEERFGSTQAGRGLDDLEEHIDTGAQASLAEIRQMAEVLIEKNPEQALRMLRSVVPSLPPHLLGEIGALVAQAQTKLAEERGRPRRAGRVKPPDEKPPSNGGDPPPDEPVPPGETPEQHREQIAKDAWSGAHTDLKAGRYKEALAAYALLTSRYAGTQVYTAHKKKIEAGLLAARAGAEGPKSLLTVEAEERGGRLEFEYTFNSYKELDDFSQEQPFASERSVDVKQERGAISLAGTSGLIHELVFLPDVQVEVNATADSAHDFGLIAIEESDAYRALIFTINNTQFTLKKGDAARPNAGHLLWYVGQGVWKDADADAHGYIKIAERGSSKITDGDRVKMEMTRTKDQRCEVSFGARSDGVHLQGDVKGDDGSTMGSARVGIFSNSGIVRVHQVRISGVVDPAWFEEHVKFLVSVTSGPE